MKKVTELDKVFGQRIRAQRLSTGMSMEEVSGKIGISWQQLQKYETGKTRVSCSRLLQICDVLDSDPSYVLMINGYKE